MKHVCVNVRVCTREPADTGKGRSFCLRRFVKPRARRCTHLHESLPARFFFFLLLCFCFTSGSPIIHTQGDTQLCHKVNRYDRSFDATVAAARGVGPGRRAWKWKRWVDICPCLGAQASQPALTDPPGSALFPEQTVRDTVQSLDALSKQEEECVGRGGEKRHLRGSPGSFSHVFRAL